jgi:hypothetical protein
MLWYCPITSLTLIRLSISLVFLYLGFVWLYFHIYENFSRYVYTFMRMHLDLVAIRAMFSSRRGRWWTVV